MTRRGLDSAWLQGLALTATAGMNLLGNAQLHSPPRFDGASYAVLARSLLSGDGYRQIEHPDRPPHGHFPPGYPAALAGVWAVTGPSAEAAHLFSIVCTGWAVLACWGWFRGLYGPRVGGLLGLALACNWRWGRDGSAILSEPLFLLQTALVLRAARRVERQGRGEVGLGLLLGASTLTRHVGIGLAVAAVFDLWLSGRRREALKAGLVTGLLVGPWAIWLTVVRQPSQVGLLPRTGLVPLALSQGLFYLRRLPDQVFGPVVEVGTVFRPEFAAPATGVAALASLAVIVGWARVVRSRRRRLAGLVPAATLPILLVWPFTEAGRFLLPLLPMILVGAVESLGAMLGGRRRAAVAVLAVSVPYAGYALVSGRAAEQERAHAAFDAACRWLARHGDRPGAILTHHPAEVFWQTGRRAVPPPSDGQAEAIEHLIDKYDVSYIVTDEDRYARAPQGPLGRFVAERPECWRPVWGAGRVVVFAARL